MKLPLTCKKTQTKHTVLIHILWSRGMVTIVESESVHTQQSHILKHEKVLKIISCPRETKRIWLKNQEHICKDE